ncbi:MAG: hypothetical protein M0R77_02370 [Gammaproteobacteria bacterium]|nr:hypothetical protein [Gammaproteobacteria bacterium]
MVTFYSYNQLIDTTLSSPQSANLPLTDTNFKVFKGTKTVVDFKIRDLDSQVIDLTDKMVILNVFSYDTNEFQFYKQLDITDAIRGRAQAVFEVVDTVDLSPAYFYYSLTVVADGTPEPYFIDQTVNTLSYFELIEGVMPTPVKSVSVLPDDYTPSTDTTEESETFWVAGPFKADSNQYRDDGLHTIAVYCENYTGKFYVEISLNDVPIQSDWSPIWLDELMPWKNYDQFTGIEPFTFQANAKWVRFKYVPQQNQDGQITKVLYRN